MLQLVGLPAFRSPETVAVAVNATGSFTATLARPVSANRAIVKKLTMDGYYASYSPAIGVAGHWTLAAAVNGYHLQAVFVCTSFSGSGSRTIRGRVVEYNGPVQVQEVAISFSVTTAEGTTDTTVGKTYRSSNAFFESSRVSGANYYLAFTEPLNDNQVRTTHIGSYTYTVSDYGFLVSQG